jgi:hypothetical protein
MGISYTIVWDATSHSLPADPAELTLIPMDTGRFCRPNRTDKKIDDKKIIAPRRRLPFFVINFSVINFSVIIHVAINTMPRIEARRNANQDPC